ncbi:MAG: putative septation protein SpoVG [Elusimicrobia bacterium ADurb.Bin231]|nr:MAG: putative septation protein SpoVG [Elusimicrobia bacterium ADurb.Bin231]
MRKWMGLLLGLMLVVSVAPVYGEGEIFVTAVNKIASTKKGVPDTYRVILNDSIEVKDIVMEKSDGKTVIKYPVYTSARGKVYPQFEVLSEQASAEIEKSVKTGKPSATVAKSMTFKISKFSKLKRPSTLKAFASVDFNNAVRVECKIMGGKKGPWVSWPAVKDETTGKYNKQVSVVNKNVKKVVENSLLKRYAAADVETETDDMEVQEEE